MGRDIEYPGFMLDVNLVEINRNTVTTDEYDVRRIIDDEDAEFIKYASCGRKIIVGPDWKRKRVIKRYLYREMHARDPYSFERIRVVPIEVGDHVICITWDDYTHIDISRVTKIDAYEYHTTTERKIKINYRASGKKAEEVLALGDVGLSEDQFQITRKSMRALPYLTRKELVSYSKTYFF